jgi:cytochrome d ubiquinol oxidase subunit I
VWITFIGVIALYAAVGVTTVLVLRSMSRRFRQQDGESGDFDESDVPYGPSRPAEPVGAGAGER